MSDVVPYPVDAAPAPEHLPWRVTAYRRRVPCFVAGDYRWYWQANVVSFVYHHFFGYGCNTWKRRP